MSLGDVYQLTDIQLFNSSVECRNVYYFRQLGGSSGAAVLAGSFSGTLLPKIIVVQTGAITHERLDVINLDNPGDYYTQDLTSGNVGAVSGQTLPPFVSFQIRLNRDSRSVRHGWKRYAGVAESCQAEGNVTDPAMTTALNDLATYQTALLGDAVDQWRQRIFRAARPTATPPVARADFGIASASFIRISTCNTRKYT